MAAATTTDQRRGPLALLAPERPDSAATRHLLLAIPFLVLSAFLFLVLQIKVPFPGLWETNPLFAYGRLRPVAFNAAIWGWVTMGFVGVAYYLTPRLTGARLWGERIANANLWFSIFVYGAGIVALALGLSEGRNMAEFPLWLDVFVLGTLAVPTVVVTMTVRRSTEEGMYVSLWYVLAGLWWLLGLYVVGNAPIGGVTDMLQTSFLDSGLRGLWIVGMGLAATYYLIPKITESPLYSRPIALIGFWSLAFAAVWIGPGRWIWGPIPDWSQEIAAVMSLALVLPAAAVITNFVGTLRPRWELLSESPPLRLALIGSVIYLVAAVLEALAPFRPTSTVVGLTPIWDGLLTAILFGAATLWIGAFSMHALPRMLGRRLFSQDLARRQLRYLVVGVSVVAATQLSTALYSGYTWIGGAQSGAYQNTGAGFANQITDALQPLYLLIALASILILVGVSIYAYNIYRTVTSGQAGLKEELVPGPYD
ncbi:MAG: cbb3-type cytochrome c oxidase subunit I [Acidimicrobiia bacterium]